MRRGNVGLIEIPGRPEGAPDIWTRAHDLWLTCRREAMRDQGEPDDVTSDGQINQDRIAVMIVGEDVAGLYSWRTFDAAVAANRNTSALRCFPDAVLDELAESHARVTVVGNLCIAPKYRRANGSRARIADSLAGTLRGLAVRLGPLVMRSRDNRSVDALIHRHGGRRIANAQAFGSASGVFVFD